MRDYRITKYNPINRNEHGHFLIDEWTEPEQIGKAFNGVKATKSDFFVIEEKYVLSILEVLKSLSINHLRVVDLDNSYTKWSLSRSDNAWLREDEFLEVEVYEDKSVGLSEIETIIRMNLRHFLSCRLEINNKFSLRFGFDFYMYVLCNELSAEVQDKVHTIGLFVEEIEPMYLMDKCDFYIDVVKKGDEFVDDEILLKKMTRNKIKIGLGLSAEHPGNHSFKITPENSVIFIDEFQFDFDNYEYYLNCDKIYW
ncbi:hypothetical protein [Kangiella koreensis]|uniref:Uncharacterized protein n=1 Tax=Kangiella koreensis (strain DSM 16069 / JCM 12317 / KCTC 12182 / SW-125) TaxID=523791 RepID=C7RAH1_KANKD|nr:hypothetical protein [Kangiella koreensis]ACV26263.1 hypothetical protein Kkor_0843 [Kangiella koreensis DSM 16069]